MKKLFVAPLASLLLLSTAAEAHNRWILPSEFSLSTDREAWIMIDASASHDTFNVDKPPMASDAIVVKDPNGNRVFPGSTYSGHRKSVTDVNLDADGTYQLIVDNGAMYMTHYKVEGQQRPHRLAGVDKTTREAKLPENAADVETMRMGSKVMAFVTKNSPTDSFNIKNEGLEIDFITHPSDIAEDEQVSFKFIMDGKPQAGVKVEIIKDGSRYRNELGSLILETDKDGMLEFTLEDAGRYLLMAKFEGVNKEDPRADRFMEQISLTFEAVLN